VWPVCWLVISINQVGNHGTAFFAEQLGVFPYGFKINDSAPLISDSFDFN